MYSFRKLYQNSSISERHFKAYITNIVTKIFYESFGHDIFLKY